MNEVERQQEIERLYRQAFAEFGAVALWSSRPVAKPVAGDALAITESLRVEGSRDARSPGRAYRGAVSCHFLSCKATYSNCSPGTVTPRVSSSAARFSPVRAHAIPSIHILLN